MFAYTKIKTFILDTLFPINCLACGQAGFWFCPDCLKKIPLLNFQVCPQCEKIITTYGQRCLDCKRYAPVEPFHLDALVATTNYNENKIAKLIHVYKYNFIQDLSAPLGKLLTQSILKSNLPLPDFIIPVPLHPRRLRWRGFNQAELLAEKVSQQLTPGFNLPILNKLLLRKKYTSPQMQIKKYLERKTNIQNSFVCNPIFLETIRNKRILLIDDIATTAATLRECAKILKKSGAQKVFAAVIARQEVKT